MVKKKINWKNKKYQTKNGHRVISMQNLPKKTQDRLFMYPLDGQVIIERSPSRMKRMNWTILGESYTDEEWDLILLDEESLNENNIEIVSTKKGKRKRKRKENASEKKKGKKKKNKKGKKKKNKNSKGKKEKKGKRKRVGRRIRKK